MRPLTVPEYPPTDTTDIPLHVVPDGGFDILGAPVGSRAYMERRLQDKLDTCNDALSLIEDIPGARIKFHLHRMSGSACRAQHLFRLVPPQISLPFAEKFDADHLAAYSRFNNVNSTEAAVTQLQLPFRKGGHGFTPLTPLVHGSYAASLIEAAPIRVLHPNSPSGRYIRMARPAMKIFVRKLPECMQPEGFALRQNLPGGLGQFEPQTLAARPERTHQINFTETATAQAKQSDLPIAGKPTHCHETITQRN